MESQLEAAQVPPASLSPSRYSARPRPEQIQLQPHRHGQGQPQLADRQHEVPGQDGEVAPQQVHRGVSLLTHPLLLFLVFVSFCAVCFKMHLLQSHCCFDSLIKTHLRMKAFIEDNEKGDFLIHSPDKKINPWMEKVSCSHFVSSHPSC